MKDNLDMKTVAAQEKPSWSIRMTSWKLNQFRVINFSVWLGYLVLATNLLSPEWASQPAVKAAVAAMAQWIPMLDSIRAIPGVNDWIRTFYAGVWLLAPFFILSGWYMRRQECKEKQEMARTFSDLTLGFGVLLVYPLGIWIVFFWPIPDINGWRDRSVSSGVVGIAHTVFIMCGYFWAWGLVGRSIYTRLRFGHVNEFLAKSTNN
ncbi:hypothetical protein RAE19_18335 [Rhodoferax sp. TBRC 17660]|uniref:Uncharacterized protein n=1 Tax=Rhodoferax potami TaxID=3068338 RepID=A0ABU3KSH5_9BURK|nr:hypothetical protein [Rhodoferax sp. TBRC 17660]MDT7520625.1 hypothetical protein [Rhodoferax sp. TBRC 17660]